MAFYNAIYKEWDAHDESLIICGDLNPAQKEIDLARPKERRWLNKVTTAVT